MSGDLDGRVVLLTGAGSGIGAASARLACARGAAVTLAGIPAEGVEAQAAAIVADGGRALAVAADVSLEADVETAVARTVATFGRLDGVVANAGIQRHRTDRDLFSMSAEEWDRTQDVNLRGAFLTVKHGLARLLEQDEGGSIVVVSSITALGGRTPNVSYSTSKHGLIGLTRHVAVHYGGRGVRCNAICPGALERTPDWDDHPDPAGRRAKMEAAIPLGRLGTPHDIAPWVVFLLSDAAAYASGGVHVVDGGITAV